MGSVSGVIQDRIDQLDKYLSSTVTNPEWFEDPGYAAELFEKEIAVLEAEQLVEMSRKVKGLLIVPNVPQWGLAR